MSNISGVSGYNSAYYTQNTKNEYVKKEQAAEVSKNEQQVQSTEKKYSVSGRTVGNAKLSKTAADYYEKLKAKYSDMEFVLVSEDKMESVKANSAAYGVSGKTVVLINEEKVERMATDEDYREKYEGIISNARVQLSQLGEKLSATGANVDGYGITVNDNGTATYFAALKESSEAQKERIEEHVAKAREEKKAEAKKEAKEADEQRLKDAVSARRDKTVTFTADSIDEILDKVSAYSFENLSNTVRTDAEKALGGNIDFSA